MAKKKVKSPRIEPAAQFMTCREREAAGDREGADAAWAETLRALAELRGEAPTEVAGPSECAAGPRHDFEFVGRFDMRPDSILCRLCGEIRAYVVPEVERRSDRGA